MTSHNSENTDPIWRNVTLRMGLLLIAIIAAFYIGVKMGKTEGYASGLTAAPATVAEKKRAQFEQELWMANEVLKMAKIEYSQAKAHLQEAQEEHDRLSARK